MATIYFAQSGEDTLVACATANEAKAIAKDGYTALNKPRNVYKVDLNKELGSREIMCALFNGETDVFTGSREVIYVSGPRKRSNDSKVDAEEEVAAADLNAADPENPYDI